MRAHPPSETTRHPFLKNGRHASQLLVNHLRALSKDLEHSIGVALSVDKVIAPHLGRALEFTVNATVTLFEARGVPRQIHVKEIRTVVLQIDTLTGCVGGHEDA